MAAEQWLQLGHADTAASTLGAVDLPGSAQDEIDPLFVGMLSLYALACRTKLNRHEGVAANDSSRYLRSAAGREGLAQTSLVLLEVRRDPDTLELFSGICGQEFLGLSGSPPLVWGGVAKSPPLAQTPGRNRAMSRPGAVMEPMKERWRAFSKPISPRRCISRRRSRGKPRFRSLWNPV